MPSLCTGKAIRNYFQTVALPEEGKICPVSVKPFGLSSDDSSVPPDVGDGFLLEALTAVASFTL